MYETSMFELLQITPNFCTLQRAAALAPNLYINLFENGST
jgi:hypothetical protein